MTHKDNQNFHDNQRFVLFTEKFNNKHSVDGNVLSKNCDCKVAKTLPASYNCICKFAMQVKGLKGEVCRRDVYIVRYT